MKQLSRFIPIGLSILTAITASTSAEAALQTWHRAVSPDRTFSIETLCNSVEISNLKAAPEVLAGMPLKRTTRVLCIQGDLLQAAAVVELNDLPEGASGFDALLQKLENNPDAKARMELTDVDGHRAVFNREFRNGMIAQTGFVELEGRKVIMLIAGYQEKSEVSESGQISALERFTKSLKIGSK